jgi:hypothetical protein
MNQGALFCFLLLLVTTADSSIITCSNDSFCNFNDDSIQTPDNNANISAICNYSLNDGLICSSISFYVVVDGFQTSVMLTPSSDLYWNKSFQCDVPDNQTSACGVSSIKNISTCTSAYPGCQVYRVAVRLSKSIIPNDIGRNSSSKVCFYTTSMPSTKRCLQIFVNLMPSRPAESRNATSFSVFLGKSISLKFSSSQWIASRNLMIYLEDMNLLQQNSRWTWEGPTLCTSQNISLDCIRSASDNWARVLIFKPTLRDNATTTSFSFTAISTKYPESSQGMVIVVFSIIFFVVHAHPCCSIWRDGMR